MLVSADTEGFLNFYAVVPSPCKNTIPIVRKIYFNEREQIMDADRQKIPDQEPVYFPIRGIDFNPETNILYTGDEAGYLQKWDLNPMLDKLRQNEASFKARAEVERQRGLTADTSSQRGSSM